jgi:hypothetical protein
MEHRALAPDSSHAGAGRKLDANAQPIDGSNRYTLSSAVKDRQLAFYMRKGSPTTPCNCGTGGRRGTPGSCPLLQARYASAGRQLPDAEDRPK